MKHYDINCILPDGGKSCWKKIPCYDKKELRGYLTDVKSMADYLEVSPEDINFNQSNMYVTQITIKNFFDVKQYMKENL